MLSREVHSQVCFLLRMVCQATVVHSAIYASFAGFLGLLFKTLDSHLELKFLDHFMTDNVVFQGFSFLLSFLIIFHTSHAYQRLIQGGSAILSIMGSFTDLASLLMAFTNTSEAPMEQQVKFKEELIRLLSALFCVSSAELEGHKQPFAHGRRLIDFDGLDKEKMRLIHDTEHKSEVLCFLIQQLLVTNMKTGVLSVAPPLLTRAFHELGAASIKFSEVRSFIVLPFPRTLLIATNFLLFIHMITTPYFMASWCEGAAGAAGWTFSIVFSLHLLNNVARELDNPFGDDVNDIDMRERQNKLNDRLLSIFLASTPEDSRIFGTPQVTFAKTYRNLTRAATHEVNQTPSCFSFAALVKRSSGEASDRPEVAPREEVFRKGSDVPAALQDELRPPVQEAVVDVQPTWQEKAAEPSPREYTNGTSTVRREEGLSKTTGRRVEATGLAERHQSVPGYSSHPALDPTLDWFSEADEDDDDLCMWQKCSSADGSTQTPKKRQGLTSGENCAKQQVRNKMPRGEPAGSGGAGGIAARGADGRGCHMSLQRQSGVGLIADPV